MPAAAANVPLAELRGRFRDGKAALLEHFAAARATSTGALRLMRALARHADRTLAQLWPLWPLPAGAALVAVGGYGYGELCPHSDIDVLVLLPGADDPPGTPCNHTSADEAAAREAVSAFIAACWDVGLEIGSSVRTVEQCVQEAARDVTVQTALLEARLVCGRRALFNRLSQRCGAALDPVAFLRAKTLEMRQRHTKYDDTPYALEPNCKESPGGLRDLQVLRWIARAAGLGTSWAAMAMQGLLTPFEVKQLQLHEGALKLIRCRLHWVAGRREDRLVFDLQTAVAESLMLKPAHGEHLSETLMRRYYWAAKAVTQLNQILLQGLQERIGGLAAAPMRPINADFLDRDGLLEIASDERYESQPRLILETFLVYEQTPGITGLSARTLRALYNARALMGPAFRRDRGNRATFMAILRQPSGQTHALRLMNQTSVLGRYLWVFRRIVGRMQHDLFHVYTVDQHILMVLRNVRRFFVPEHAHEYPFCSELAGQWDEPWILFVAALFHDVAKGRGGDHSELGARDARRFCRDHGVARADAELIEFLVRHHLLMSQVAQREDLYDPQVIARFAARVTDARHLTALYLLTVADIRGTGPQVWNAWKGKLLEDLYRLALRALGGSTPHADAEIESRKAEARQCLALHSTRPGAEEPLWRVLDIGYFARHDPADIAWHVRALWRHLSSPQAVVRARPSPAGEGLQVLIYAPDQPDLFARICGYFDSAGFSIQDAKIHTTANGYALDTFQVISLNLAEHSLAAYRDLIALVEVQAAKALDSHGALPTPRAGRVSRRVRSFPMRPRVTLQPDEKAQRWLLSISASDRSGLLYAIARVLAAHHINVHLAKITTLGERVEDTFLIDGHEMQMPKRQLAVEEELLDALAVPV